MTQATAALKDTLYGRRIDTQALKRSAQYSSALPMLKQLAHLMDSAFRIPGTQRRIGLDGLIGLIPGVGDALAAAVSSTLVAYAVKLGARKRVLARMVANIGIDMLIGAIPLVGDWFDLAHKANTKNIALLEEEAARTSPVIDATAFQVNKPVPMSA